MNSLCIIENQKENYVGDSKSISCTIITLGKLKHLLVSNVWTVEEGGTKSLRGSNTEKFLESSIFEFESDVTRAGES